jgi:hypothetical protein
MRISSPPRVRLDVEQGAEQSVHRKLLTEHGPRELSQAQ